MAVTLEQLLAPNATHAVVKQIAGPSVGLLELFGMNPTGNGSNLVGYPTRALRIDVFNQTRRSMAMVPSGAPAASTNPQPFGVFEAEAPFFREYIPLHFDRLRGIRQPGAAELDQQGETYVMRQIKYLGQKSVNARIASLGGMMRGRAYVHRKTPQESELLWTEPAAGSNFTTVNYQRDAALSGNRPASWGLVGTDIVGDFHLLARTVQQKSGRRLAWAICGSKVWSAVIQNTSITKVAGTSSCPFTVVDIQPYMNGDNGLALAMVVRLIAIPQITWVVFDDVLEFGDAGTLEPVIGENEVFFCCDPRESDVFIGAEPEDTLVKKDGDSPETVRGQVLYSTETLANPSRVNLHGQDGFMAVMAVPNSTAYPTVLF